MKIERSESQNAAAEKFGQKAAELSGAEAKEGIVALAKDGLIKLAAQDGGWSLVAAALQSIAHANPSLSLAAAMHILAADMLRRWGGDKYPEIIEKIEGGDAIAALVAPVRVSEAPQLVSKSGQNTLDGMVGRVCNAPIADVFAVLAAGESGLFLIALDKNDEGVSVGDKVDTIGMSGVPISPVAFKDVAVAGEKTAAPDTEPDALKARWSLCITAILSGCSAAALEEVRNFTNEHTVEGKPVGKFQAQRFHIAEMFASLDTARLMVDRAAYAIDSGDREARTLCDCARLLADEVVEEISTKGSKVLGATGTVAGVKFKRLMDDAETARFAGEHPDSLLSSVFDSIAEQF